MNYGIYKDNSSARKIISSMIKNAEKPINKYNSSLLNCTAEWTGETAADYRGGEDTGMEPEYIGGPGDEDMIISRKFI